MTSDKSVYICLNESWLGGTRGEQGGLYSSLSQLHIFLADCSELPPVSTVFGTHDIAAMEHYDIIDDSRLQFCDG